MTSEQFKKARKSLGYTQSELADLWGMGANGARTIRRWEQASDDRPINPIAIYCITLMQLYDISKAA
jgi:transcriptional regulator with XRE-family HTH domain